MKSLSMVLALALMAAAMLSGCVIVPLGGWYGHGYGHAHGGGGYYHPYGPYPYRGR